MMFAVVSLALMMMSVDMTIVATVLHTIETDLGAPLSWTSWTITVYALGQIVTMPIAGRLGDVLGRRRVFLAAVVVFVIASAGCALSQNVVMLIGFRLMQSIGGGAFMPTAAGIIAERFGPDRDRAIGLFTTILPIGGLLGPVIGGVIVAHASWRAVFVVNLPVGVVVLIAATVLIPRDSAPSQRQRIDVVGASLFAIGLLSVMTAISSLAAREWHDPLPLGGFVLAVGAFTAMVLWSQRAPAPFLPLRLLYGHGFAAVNVINFLYGTVIFGMTALVPIYVQERYGFSALNSGLVLAARAVGMIALAGLAVMALRRTGYRTPMVVGFVLSSMGLIALGLPAPAGHAWLWLGASAALTGIGMGASIPASNNAGLRLAPDDVAAVSGVRGMLRQAGGIVTVSVVTAIVASSTHAGRVLGDSFVVLGLILVLMSPLVLWVPNHRGRW